LVAGLHLRTTGRRATLDVRPSTSARAVRWPAARIPFPAREADGDIASRTAMTFTRATRFPPMIARAAAERAPFGMETHVKLYTLGLSPNALRVRAVINELGLEVALEEVNFRDTAARNAALLPHNPNNKVPVLVDGDFVLWESRAINAYLAGLKPESGLYPHDLRKRAVVDQWSYWHATHLGPAMQTVNFERFMKARFGMGEPDEAAAAASQKEALRFLKVLDANLADKPWVAGELSIADFGLASTFLYRDVVGLALDETPHVAAWIARVEARPSYQAAAAPVAAFVEG
jgi:glutathione S-transferase